MYKIIILLQSFDYVGEVEFLHRIKIACTHLGWICHVCLPKDPSIQKLKPDFIISLIDHTRIHKGCPNYLWLSHGLEKYFEKDGKLKKSLYKHLTRYDGYLVAFQEIDVLANYIQKQRRSWWDWRRKEFYGLFWYPTCQATLFQKNTFQKLFYCGDTWDQTRSSDKYRQFFKALDQAGYFEVYGPSKRWEFIEKSYKGFIPLDGVSLLDKIQEAGVTLILHSQRHLNSAAPTSRIFEAAAASSVIISDNHPFIREKFGNSILYIDQHAESHSLFAQVDKYMRWINDNPAAAADLACKAHKIFSQQYTLEQQLMLLAHMHEELLQKRKQSYLFG
ncbi:MAG: glycosyl transferase [Chlamydiales bacterium]|jgi:hypothetical protein|nr:glycosyl transferase [Chlamydiales bacterium]